MPQWIRNTNWHLSLPNYNRKLAKKELRWINIGNQSTIVESWSVKTVPGETSAVIGKNDNKQTNRQTDRQTNKRLLGCELWNRRVLKQGQKSEGGSYAWWKIELMANCYWLSHARSTTSVPYRYAAYVVRWPFACNIIYYTVYITYRRRYFCLRLSTVTKRARSLARGLNDAWIALCSVSGAALCARRALRQPTWLLIACTLRSQALLRHCTDSRTETLGQLLIISSA